MLKILSIIFFIVSFSTYGQNDLTNEPWEIGCDTLDGSQLDMNLCSLDAYMIADSILNHINTELTHYFESNLLKEKEYITSPTDSIQISFVKLLERQLALFKKSQKDYYDFRESTIEVINLQYDGGSMKPLAANIYALRLTVNQIETIRIMIEEIDR